MNLNIQNSWPHWSSTYSWQFSTSNHFHVKWLTNPRPQGDLNSSNSKYFPLCPSWSISVAQLLFKASSLIFCVLIRQCQSLHTVCFWIFTVPVIWSILGIAVLHPPLMVSIVQSFLKASLSRSSVQILPLLWLKIVWFWNFSQHVHAPPLKTPLAPSPACFNLRLYYFWKPPPPVILCKSALLCTLNFRNSTHCHHQPVQASAGTPLTSGWWLCSLPP